jgi:predicted nuclease of predicted toxin-antitoxin system
VRFLADENFPGDAVDALRAAGHDVLWASTAMGGSPDAAVLARAADEGRILLTFDTDFGDLVFRTGLPAESGVVLFRLHQTPIAERARLAAFVLQNRTDWAGRFSVVRGDRIRSVPLPAPGRR